MQYCVKEFYILIAHKIWEQLTFRVLYKRGLMYVPSATRT